MEISDLYHYLPAYKHEKPTNNSFKIANITYTSFATSKPSNIFSLAFIGRISTIYQVRIIRMNAFRYLI